MDRWLLARGLTGIRIDRTIAQLLRARRDLRDVRDSSTPTAMLGLLRVIDTGGALKPESRLLLLDMMRRCRTGSNRIRGILPPGAKVENKTGTLAGYTGDVGFLTTPTGRRIAVAFFGRGGENRPGVIATAARMIYDAFGAEFAADTAAAGSGEPSGIAVSCAGAGARPRRHQLSTRPAAGPSSARSWRCGANAGCGPAAGRDPFKCRRPRSLRFSNGAGQPAHDLVNLRLCHDQRRREGDDVAGDPDQQTLVETSMEDAQASRAGGAA